jgi:hypothetical protein
MNDLQRSRRPWAWASLGFAGSLLVAYAAPRAVSDHTVGWWYQPPAPSARATAVALVYIGMAALCVAWLALGRRLPSRRPLLMIAVAWMLPLALAPPMFSRDVYSYLAQGTILHIGHNPYNTAPRALAGLGHKHVLDAVSTFWRGTTAPYGPLFLGMISVIVGVVGSNLIAGVLLIRLIEIAGLVLLAIYVPRLTRAMGTDPARGLWLVVLNPLTALELVAAGHNDLLMIGILAAGVAIALEGRPLRGVAVCALAATVKLPALAGALFILVAWAWAEEGVGIRLMFLASGALIVAAVLGVVTLVTGVGLGWISTSLFSTPAKVHLAITPATGIGWTASALLGDVGIPVSARGLEDGLGMAAFALTAVFGLVALYRVRVTRLVVLLGSFLVVAAACGPAAWPWYFSWGLVLIAALRGPQRCTALAVACALSVFAVKPNGILAVPLQSAPAVVALYAMIGVAVWYRRRRRDDDRGASGSASPRTGLTPSALAEASHLTGAVGT